MEQNVFHVGQGSVVKYYFSTRKTMTAGDRVELLTNYGPKYEDIRRQQGYGLKNASGMALGCHESRAARYEYAFEERDIVTNVIHNEIEDKRLSPCEVANILRRLVECSAEPLHILQRREVLTCRQ
jgi:hypothetical protein